MNTLKLISALAVFVVGLLLLSFGIAPESSATDREAFKLGGVAVIALSFYIAL